MIKQMISLLMIAIFMITPLTVSAGINFDDPNSFVQKPKKEHPKADEYVAEQDGEYNREDVDDGELEDEDVSGWGFSFSSFLTGAAVVAVTAVIARALGFFGGGGSQPLPTPLRRLMSDPKQTRGGATWE